MSVQQITTDTLIPGRGEPVTDGVVLIEDGRIVYAGPAAGAPPGRNHAAPVHVPVLMPGLWDCHVHLHGLRGGGEAMTEYALTHPALAGARAARDAHALLCAGYTSVREVGGYGTELARAVEEGSLTGPSIYAAGSPISPTGGHVDAHALPHQIVADACHRNVAMQLADGVPECLRGVRLQLRRGARLIKVCTSGGVLSDLDHPLHQQFSDDELRAIVEEAARADRIVAAHCHGKAGIMAALRAGCRTIEHGSHLDEEAAVVMREAGAILVPTRTIIDAVRAMTGRFGADAARTAAELADAHLRALHLAREHGVTVAAGSDLGITTPGTPASHGRNAHELVHLVTAGYTPAQAIEAATATAPRTLGPQAPHAGLLAPGYAADLIAPVTDPLDDISVLTDPANITHVWKHGTLVKTPT